MNIEELLYEEESNTLDFKEEQYRFIGERNDHIKCEILKDILAFANAWRQSDAYILIGVREIKGAKSEVVGISEDIDDAALQQFIDAKTNKTVNFSYKTTTINEKKVAYIHIPTQDRPFFIKKKYGKLHANRVYIRKGSSTGEADPTEVASMGEKKGKENTRVENPADYKIIAKLTPLKINLDYELKEFEERFEKAKVEIKNYKLDKSAMHRGKKLIDVGSQFTNIEATLKSLDIKPIDVYDIELLAYRDNLLDYVDRYEENKGKMISLFNNSMKNKYLMELEIENTGNTSDEFIDIKVSTYSNKVSRLIDEISKQASYIPGYPKKPSRQATGFEALSPYNRLLDINTFNDYRQNIDISDDKISVVIRDMNVGDTVKVVTEKIIIKLENVEHCNLDFIVKSKNSTAIIKKEVELVFVDKPISIKDAFSKK